MRVRVVVDGSSKEDSLLASLLDDPLVYLHPCEDRFSIGDFSVCEGDAEVNVLRVGDLEDVAGRLLRFTSHLHNSPPTYALPPYFSLFLFL